LPGDRHGGFGERPGETDREQSRHRAPGRLNQKLCPAAVSCLEDDLGHLATYLRFPKEHWARIRHSNFIERTFTRRRVKVMGRLPGERSCLSLVWAVLDRASRGWRGAEMTPKVVRELQLLRHELFSPPHKDGAEEGVRQFCR
jgi:transposase-like protein